MNTYMDMDMNFIHEHLLMVLSDPATTYNFQPWENRDSNVIVSLS